MRGPWDAQASYSCEKVWRLMGSHELHPDVCINVQRAKCQCCRKLMLPAQPRCGMRP